MRARAAALFISCSVLVAGCGSSPSRPDLAAAPDTEARVFIDLPEIEGRNLIHLGILVDQNLKGGAIDRGQAIGRYAPLPRDRGAPFQAELKESERRYAAGDRVGAAEVLRPVVESFKVDGFVLNGYARALYWTDKTRAFDVYSRLLADVDAMPGKSDGSDRVVVHSWFSEAYWKKGTLHLDREEWHEAAFEISRYLVASGLATATMTRLRSEPSAEQALQYLAEAYALMGDEARAVSYARRTLQVAPDNTYVFEFVPAEKVNDVDPH